MSWKWARDARHRQALERRGLPVVKVYNPETGVEEWAKVKLKQLTGPGLARGSGTSQHVRYRDIRAIGLCVAALRRTAGQGSTRDVEYKPYTKKLRDGRIREVNARDVRINMYRPVSRWWPVCLAAYKAGNADLLI
jgi:hypothetical protein